LRGRRDVNIESDQLFTCRQGGIHTLALLSGGDRSNSQADIARLSGGWAVDPNALADLAMNNKGVLSWSAAMPIGAVVDD
jgi:hypothetical protein